MSTDFDIEERKSVLRQCQVLTDDSQGSDKGNHSKAEPPPADGSATDINDEKTKTPTLVLGAGPVKHTTTSTSGETLPLVVQRTEADLIISKSTKKTINVSVASQDEKIAPQPAVLDVAVGGTTPQKPTMKGEKEEDYHRYWDLAATEYGNDRQQQHEDYEVPTSAVSLPSLRRMEHTAQRSSVPGAVACEGISTSDDDNDEADVESVVSGGGPIINTTTNNGLPSAELIDPEEECRVDRPQAEMIDQETQEKARKERQKKTAHWVGGAALLGIIIIVALVASIVTTKQETKDSAAGNKTATTTTTIPPSSGPVLTMDDYIQALLPKDTLEDIIGSSSTTPQRQAFDWLIEDPHVQNYSDERLIQRYALATFFFSSGGPTFWFDRNGWLDYNIHECDWFGQETHGFYATPEAEDGLLYNVTNVTAPCSSSSDGDTFEHLWLKFNGLQGTIPEELFLLSSLKSISLDRNQLQGTLSTKMGYLKGLEALGLYNNKLDGTIPTEVGVVTNLEFLWLYNNGITGHIPSQLGMLSNSLMHMQLDTTPITGSIPTEIGQLSKLKGLWHWNSMLTGPIPSEIGNCLDMEIIAIDINLFSGSIPSEIGRLKKLERFNSAAAFLSGTLPTQLGEMSALWSLALEQNNLSGSLPTQFGRLTDMWILRSSYNALTGKIPTQIGLWQTWPHAWDFAHNSFTGTIPTEIALQHGLWQVRFNNNNFTGIIPSQLGLLKDLGVLILHSNSFSGKIPKELGSLDMQWDAATNTTIAASTNVTELWLHNNQLTGEVPTTFSLLGGLSVLTLHDNRGLQGEVSPSLCTLDSWGSARHFDGWWEKEAWDPSYEPFLGISIDCELVACNCSVCNCGSSWSHTEAHWDPSN